MVGKGKVKGHQQGWCVFILTVAIHGEQILPINQQLELGMLISSRGDSPSTFASAASLVLQFRQQSPGRVSLKASSMRMSMRPAVELTTAWSIMPLMHIGVHARVCSE